ncbi:MAG TPA: rRNA maturation RNase YbeY [Candidatus Binataceae bacterium]|nr:rRNA maturation RNase YbeY [Candidatus Binataceae bacterium]
MAVALRCESAEARRYAAGVRKDARDLMRLLDLQHCELSIVIADDAFVHALNREFRGKDRPTDVLSFPQWEGGEAGAGRERRGAIRAAPLPAAPPAMTAPSLSAQLGDVVISVDTARRQARRLGVAPAARIRTLLVHGMLHLLGYDHERSPAEARRMFARERELAAALAGGRAGGSSRRSRSRAGSAGGALAPPADPARTSAGAAVRPRTPPLGVRRKVRRTPSGAPAHRR